MGHGGKRPGAGGKPGPRGQYKSTITKQQARDALRELVIRKLERLVDAQLANAQGLKYLVTRDKKTGKFIRVTQAMAKAKQGSDEETIEVWEKDPNVQAFSDLLDRALDKPVNAVQLEHSGDVTTRIVFGGGWVPPARKSS
jgi:hypothetical protein